MCTYSTVNENQLIQSNRDDSIASEMADGGDTFSWTVSERSKPRQVKANLFDIFLTAVSILVSSLNIGSDVRVAIHYFRDGSLVFGVLIATFIVLPFAIKSFLSIQIRFKNRNQWKSTKMNATDVILFGLFGLLTRRLYAMYHGVRNRTVASPNNNTSIIRLDHYQQMTDHLFHANNLQIVETSLQSAPQFLLQFYMLSKVKYAQDFQIYSVWISFTSLAWTLTSSSRQTHLFLSDGVRSSVEANHFGIYIKSLFDCLIGFPCLYILHFNILVFRLIPLVMYLFCVNGWIYWAIISLHLIVTLWPLFVDGQSRNAIEKAVPDAIQRTVFYVFLATVSLFVLVDVKSNQFVCQPFRWRFHLHLAIYVVKSLILKGIVLVCVSVLLSYQWQVLAVIFISCGCLILVSFTKVVLRYVARYRYVLIVNKDDPRSPPTFAIGIVPVDHPLFTDGNLKPLVHLLINNVRDNVCC